jgi:hypothetical protein
VTNTTLRVLLLDLAVKELPHLGRRPKFPIAAWMVWIFDAFDTERGLASFPNLFSTAAEERFMNRTELLAMKFHWDSLKSLCPGGHQG